ncbi:MAG: hypothetical protein WBA28_01190 [Microbacteriaceae bacterium]
MIFRRLSVLVIWAFSLAAITFIGIAYPSGVRSFPVSIALGVTVLLTFVMQLVLSEKEGAVIRIMASIAGSLVIFILGLALISLLSH